MSNAVTRNRRTASTGPFAGAVHADCPRANPCGDLVRAVHVVGPQRRGQPVARIVRDPHPTTISSGLSSWPMRESSNSTSVAVTTQPLSAFGPRKLTGRRVSGAGGCDGCNGTDHDDDARAGPVQGHSGRSRRQAQAMACGRTAGPERAPGGSTGHPVSTSRAWLHGFTPTCSVAGALACTLARLHRRRSAFRISRK